MVIAIFCDGACPGNGKRSAVAGWAWAAWPGGVARGEPAYSGSGKPPGLATNQRAELTALWSALQWARGQTDPAVIHTDSMYAINCTQTWGPGWKRRGWKREGGEIQNLDIIRPLVELWAAEAVPRGWRLQHVRGHQTGSSPEAWGNNWVDRAAVAACGSAATGGRPVSGPKEPTLPAFIHTQSTHKTTTTAIADESDLDAIVHEPRSAVAMQHEESSASVRTFPPSPPRGGHSFFAGNDLRRWFGGK